MENKVKDTNIDVWNDFGDHRYCSDGYQYHRHRDQYPADQKKERQSKKQPHCPK